jgi:hypothetical protein
LGAVEAVCQGKPRNGSPDNDYSEGFLVHYVCVCVCVWRWNVDVDVAPYPMSMLLRRSGMPKVYMCLPELICTTTEGFDEDELAGLAEIHTPLHETQGSTASR